MLAFSGFSPIFQLIFHTYIFSVSHFLIKQRRSAGTGDTTPVNYDFFDIIDKNL